MRLLIPLGLICITILVTAIMLISGNGFYITYIPAASGDGIAQYSPLWILVVEVVAAYGLFARQLWGVVIVFAPALAMSLDIYPAWMILGHPDMSLIFHILVTTLVWCTAVSGVVAIKFLNAE
jgi:hypothetical protein